VSTPQRKYPFRFCLGGLPERRRWMPVVCIFVLLAKADGQVAGGNAGTNQPAPQTIPNNSVPTNSVPANPVPIAPSETPPTQAEINQFEAQGALTNESEAQNSLTNQFGVTAGQPPPFGPATLGSAQPASPIMGTSAIAGGPAPLGPIAVGPGIPLWGPIDIHPHLLYSFTYGNGIEAQPGQQSQTAINTIAPGFLLDLGKYWTIDYTPSFSFYSNPAFKDATDESVSLRGAWSTEDWVLGLSQGYVSSSQPLVETGAQTKQDAYATALTASYQMGSQFSLQLGLNQNFSDAQGQGLSDLKEWTTSDWLNYQANAMFGMGVGLVLGYDAESASSSMPFEQLQGKINFHPGTKFTLSLSGGVEDRQFVDPSAPPLINPIFSGSLTYRVFQPTTISLNGSRTVTPSLYQNETEVITSVSGSIRQQLSKKFSIQGDAGYTTFPQTSIVPEPLPQFFLGAPPISALQEVNNEDSTFFRFSLSYTVVDRLTFSAFYSLSDYASGQANFDYSSRQVGFSLSYRY
jgi:hypothetical protein